MSTTGDIREDTERSIFGWIKSRFPTVPYADLTRVVLETDQRQLPRSHAEKYELKTIWYWYPLYCLGGIAFVAFVILTITGILLGFFYVPDGRLELNPTTSDLTNPAWNSMLVIMNEIPFGFIVRGMHHWAAHIMIEGAANIGINMTRASPVIGDQLARLLFGDINTLTGVYILRWYWIHVFILPLLGTALMILHMGLVWLQGVAEPH